MNGYFLTGIIACAVGLAVGCGGMHYTVDAAQLSAERLAHASDNKKSAAEITAVARAGAKKLQDEVAKGQAFQGQIATLDQLYQQERAAHDWDNSKNDTAIASGARRLWLTVASCSAPGGSVASQGSTASSVGDGAAGYAELSPATGLALYGITDDADSQASALSYLQSYVAGLQRMGVVTTPMQ